MNMIGTVIRVFGRVWIVTGVNYLGDYDVVRYVAHRRVWQRSSISGTPLPVEHNHHWSIIPTGREAQLRRAIINSEKLRPWVSMEARNARTCRRASAWRGVLRRFFRRVKQL